MKHKILMLSIIMTITFAFGIKNIEARNYSDYFQNPYMYQVTPAVKGNLAHIRTSYSSCRGENAGVIFSGFKPLPSYYTLDDALVHMTLYEDDPPSSEPDERIKNYYANYIDRVIYEVNVGKLITSGNIDTAGDPNCELYMDFLISGFVGGHPIQDNIFTYRMFME